MNEKYYLIGSQSLYLQNNNFKISPNADYDVISSEPISDLFDFHSSNFLNNSKFDHYATLPPIIVDGHQLFPINIKGLSIIKRSHLWRNLSFGKHITMYHKHLKCDLDEFDLEILKERTDLTHLEFNHWKPPSLKKTVTDFFDDYVAKKYDHDYLHTLFSYYDRPLYESMQDDPSIAWCNKKDWDKFTYNDKVKCVSEECMVIAAERFLIPVGWEYHPKLAYSKALEKVCTTLTSGWFRDFAIDHYPEILYSYDVSKFDKVKNILTR